MPKVKEGYLLDKKNQILDAAFVVFAALIDKANSQGNHIERSGVIRLTKL